MKKAVKTGLVGLLVFGSTACIAQDLEVCTSTSYTIPSTVGVSGATYTWWENGAEIPGAGGESYTNQAGKPAGTYVYVRRAYTAACGWQSSNAFVVYVAGSAPVITKPADGCAGINYVFTVPLEAGATYNWTGGGSANGNSYTYSNAAAGALTVTVRKVTSACTSEVSAATVTASAIPTITTQPADTSTCWGPSTQLSVAASPVTARQWLKNGSAITEGWGYTTATYTTNGVTTAANYSVVVANGACSVTSNEAVVSMKIENCVGDPTFTAFSPDNNAPTGSTWTLYDDRDGGNGNVYAVKKMADGRIWMVEDMKFGNCNDIPYGTEGSSWGSAGSKAQVMHAPTVYPGFVGHCTSATDDNTPANRGYMYNWPGALNEQDAYNEGGFAGCSGKPNGGACQGICPDGWHVPTYNEYLALRSAISGADVVLTAINLIGYKAIDANPNHWHGVLGGLCSSRGVPANSKSDGYYWYSSLVDDLYYGGANHVHYESSTFGGRLRRYWGGSVRCVMN
jgi:uncharacterized protein (TIGR02145 family)